VVAWVTAVVIASNSAVPNWAEVWNRPLATPCSSGRAPSVAAMLRVEKHKPKAIPIRAKVGNSTGQ
jgi:hypothetical protein